MSDVEQTPKTKREQVAKRVFIDATGASEDIAQEAITGILFQFSNDTEKAVQLSDFPENIQHQFAIHGMGQKLGDALAMAKGTPIEDRIDQLEATMDSLLEGNWTMRKASDGTPKTLLFAALVRINCQKKGVDELSPEDMQKVTDMLNSRDEDERKALAKNPTVAAEIGKIKIERAAAAQAKLEAEAAEADDDEILI